MLTMQYSRSALTGMRRHTTDACLLLAIEGALVLSAGATPRLVLAGAVLDAATDAYRLWSAHRGLTPLP